jgi:DNA-binding LacI/PurR family transcriptional regulator
MTVTLHDVASAAGVSIKTVSNVVRGQGSFSESTRVRVEEAVERLGYRPNLAARGLRSGRLGVIGLVVPDIRNPYFAELADAVMRASAEHDLIVVLEQSDGDRDTELELLRGRGTRMVDGILFSVYGLSGGADGLAESVTKPVVILGEPVPGWPTDFVSMHHREGVHAATEQLISDGRQRIAVLGARPHELVGSAQLRLEGYYDALGEAGIEPSPELLVDIDLWTRARGADAVRGLLGDGVEFDAIVAFNDALALGAIRALEDRGLAIPDDVAVVGFDDIEEARYSAPSLSTVRPAVHDLARTAVRFLLDRIDSDAVSEPSRGYRAACTLELRESTGPAGTAEQAPSAVA